MLLVPLVDARFLGRSCVLREKQQREKQSIAHTLLSKNKGEIYQSCRCGVTVNDKLGARRCFLTGPWLPFRKVRVSLRSVRALCAITDHFGAVEFTFPCQLVWLVG